MVSKELVEKAREIHGHICPFLVLGLRMSEVAMARLGVRRAGVVESIREDIVAIVEVNNCLADGVQVARALASEPRILLLDEPTANLDMKYQVAVLELVKRLTREKKLTVIMALHDLTQAYRYSTKAILLNQGKIVALGETIEVIREETIENIYGVKVKILRDIKAVTPIA
jgi:iron complex transport system ATP-binding protein